MSFLIALCPYSHLTHRRGHDSLAVARGAVLAHAAFTAERLQRMPSRAIAVRTLNGVLDLSDFSRAAAGEATQVVRIVRLYACPPAEGTLCHTRAFGFAHGCGPRFGYQALAVAREAALPQGPLALGSSLHLMRGAIAGRALHRVLD